MILHFTRKFDILISILESSSFMLGYCTEDFSDKKKRVISSAAHPMVCFSEFKEDELGDRKVTYGGYAVALSKEWAINNGLNPVLYVEKNSQVAAGLAALLKARQKDGKDAIPKSLRLPIMQIKCFTKHETGYNSYLDQDNFCFKEENEWRYVPTIKQIGGGRISLDRSKFIKNKDEYNNSLSSYQLRFLFSDIKAIYVQTEAERQEIHQQDIPLVKIKLSMWK